MAPLPGVDHIRCFAINSTGLKPRPRRQAAVDEEALAGGGAGGGGCHGFRNWGEDLFEQILELIPEGDFPYSFGGQKCASDNRNGALRPDLVLVDSGLENTFLAGSQQNRQKE